MDIRTDDLRGAAVIALLQQHLDDMYRITPAESVHALDVQGLRASNVSFWCAWEGNELLGCAALKELDAQNGEVKSMRTDPQHRGKGVASHLLSHVIAVAQQRNYASLWLETGSFAEFVPARSLYERHGFQYCEPFADYSLDPNSVFMVKHLVQA